MFRQISAFVALVLLFAVADVNGADVVMDDTWCDDSLPIYAKNMVLNCGNEGDGCTMGKSAGIYGKVLYNGVSNYVENNSAYVTTSVSKFKSITSVVTDYTLSKTLYSLQEINICSSVHSQDGGCPADEWYTLQAAQVLPSVGGDKDWFLTGQAFGIDVKIYSDSDGSTLIGHCTADVTTIVTESSAWMGMVPPSAAMSGLVMLGILAVASAGICVGCWWMDLKDKELEGHDFEMLEDPRQKQKAVV